MPESVVLYEERGSVAVVTLNRPERLNTLTEEVVQGVADAIDRASSSRPVRAIVVRGAGRALTGGYDLGPDGGTDLEEGTLSVMLSGPAPILARVRPVLSCVASNVFEVGALPGQGQLMKVINNYLSISSFVTTSEALAFGVRSGLAMDSILDVVNASTGQNFTTLHTFPRHVLTGAYDMNGVSTIMPKDLGLFVDAAARDGAPCFVAQAALRVVEAFASERPEADQSEIYRFIRDGGFAADALPE